MAPPAFSPNSSLLNPKFDGYKLKLLEQTTCVYAFSLPAPGASQSTVSTRRIVPFTEVSARIKHNHLRVALDGEGCVYIDQNGGVVYVRLSENQTPTFRMIFEIPQEISQSASEFREYPVVLPLTLDRWLVSDGHGRFYTFIQTSTSSAPADSQSNFELVDDAGSLVPCRLLHVRETEGRIAALVTRRAKADNSASDSNAKSAPAYNLVALNLDPETNTLVELWTVTGPALPADVQFDSATNSYIVSSASVFATSQAPEVASPAPKPDEIAPIPRANENLDSTPDPGAPPIHPYSWTQTDDSVTIMFPLPSSTTTSAIRITIARLHLTLSILTSAPSAIPLPKYAQCAWWGDVDHGASLWTWERAPDERQGNVGLLTLHLEKKHAGTRWSHIFAPSTGEPEVPETLDPSELASIRESLEKYTAELSSAEGRGAMPSLANPDADEELDAPGQVGQRVAVARVHALSGHLTIDQREASVLSTPLPIAHPEDRAPSLVVRRDIDGLLFEAQRTTPESSPWTHVSTFSALSFVLASKRDTRFVMHYNNRVVLAFESGSTHGTGNVYIYRAGEQVKSQWAQQSILSVASQSTGSLLGVGAIASKGDRSIVVCCLCEHQFVVLKEII
ncbi:hypothetical protein BDV93DRAFT_488925 [Ceratobasidium sp. AG-I]|nr:hypothetical protein BDV93DRAFT_488925 [Ceratobasidium sp. AG-I]